MQQASFRKVLEKFLSDILQKCLLEEAVLILVFQLRISQLFWVCFNTFTLSMNA